MPIQLDHTVIPAEDKEASATFLAEILGLESPKPFGPFVCVETANGVSLDYADTPPLHERWGSGHGHYAFLVTEDEFDAIFARVQARGLRFWADPLHKQEGVINNNGRGFYFEDPSGHNMEILTRSYGT
jgi:catechol 2,3-dioxygenase-like lactoylglutathione lyase family enzyme